MAKVCEHNDCNSPATMGRLLPVLKLWVFTCEDHDPVTGIPEDPWQKGI